MQQVTFIEGKIRPNFLSDKFFNFTKTFCFDNYQNAHIQLVKFYAFWLGPRALARGLSSRV
jgi:hypothetical protein